MLLKREMFSLNKYMKMAHIPDIVCVPPKVRDIIGDASKNLNRSRKICPDAFCDNSGFQEPGAVDDDTKEEDNEEVFKNSSVDIG